MSGAKTQAKMSILNWAPTVLRGHQEVQDTPLRHEGDRVGPREGVGVPGGGAASRHRAGLRQGCKKIIDLDLKDRDHLIDLDLLCDLDHFW